MTFFPGIRLHVVTGKGGTGKTTVAAALAIALSRGGKRVLVAEVEGRQGLAPLFGKAPLPHAETQVLKTADGGTVSVLPVDPEKALIEYLDLFYHLGRAGRVLQRMGATDFVTTIAPGLRDVLLIGKVKEAAVRRAGSGRYYDAVVLDAPPTGRIVKFLGATDEVAQIAKVGPIRAQSESVMALLRGDETAIHLVTLLEEMPVQETVDGVDQIVGAGLPVGAIVVNRVREERLAGPDLTNAAAGRLDLDAVGAALADAGLTEPGLAKVLAEEANEHARRVALQQAMRADLEALGRPLVELPLLPEHVDLDTLTRLAERLA
ncbi:MAG TPA: ArsA-related P-loop ATPase [Frankiaceae bacterium]|nr:ArsA-related P-loop ATPase [Frankiaceae bacterium]